MMVQVFRKYDAMFCCKHVGDYYPNMFATDHCIQINLPKVSTVDDASFSVSKFDQKLNQIKADFATLAKDFKKDAATMAA